MAAPRTQARDGRVVVGEIKLTVEQIVAKLNRYGLAKKL